MSRSLGKCNQKAKQCQVLSGKSLCVTVSEEVKTVAWVQRAHETEGREVSGRVSQWTCCEWRARKPITVRVGDAKTVGFWFSCLEIREATHHRDAPESNWVDITKWSYRMGTEGAPSLWEQNRRGCSAHREQQILCFILPISWVEGNQPLFIAVYILLEVKSLPVK